MTNIAFTAAMTLALGLASGLPYIQRQVKRGHPVGTKLYIIAATIGALAAAATSALLSPTAAIAFGLLAFLAAVVAKTDLVERLIPTETCISVAAATTLLGAFNVAAGRLETPLLALLICGGPVVATTLLFLINKGGLGDVTVTLAALAATWWWVGFSPSGPTLGFLALALVTLICYIPHWGAYQGKRSLAAGPPLLAYYLTIGITASIGA